MSVDAATSPPVPPHYRGVWARRLLKTPESSDDSSFVRWLQAGRWHADLRIPAAARPEASARMRARQQGFSGVTTVQTRDGRECCIWHRLDDLQPPGLTPDAGWMAFETPDRVVETGVHGPYLEVWERLPDSTGRFVVLQSDPDAATGVSTRLLIAGACAMRVRPRSASWPADTVPGDELGGVLRRHPDQVALLDFEISYGRLDGGQWSITQSTLPALEGRCLPCRVQRLDEGRARVDGLEGAGVWRVLEWDGAGERIV